MHQQSGRDSIPEKRDRIGYVGEAILASTEIAAMITGAGPEMTRPLQDLGRSLQSLAAAEDEQLVDAGDLIAWSYHLHKQGKGREVAEALATIDDGGPSSYRALSFDPADN